MKKRPRLVLFFQQKKSGDTTIIGKSLSFYPQQADGVFWAVGLYGAKGLFFEPTRAKETGARQKS